jgi:hypothetical protein
MEMLLMALAMTLMGVVVSGVLFAAATNEGDAVEVPAEAALAPSGFFAEGRPTLASPPVSVEVLLLQIEGHVRMEQAAVESFIAKPTVEALHTPTLSPLVH